MENNHNTKMKTKHNIAKQINRTIQIKKSTRKRNKMKMKRQKKGIKKRKGKGR